MATEPEYVPMTKDELVALLIDIVERVKIGDSFEGFVNYLMPDTDDSNVYAMVHARYRVGNRDGQGGMRVIGNLTND